MVAVKDLKGDSTSLAMVRQFKILLRLKFDSTADFVNGHLSFYMRNIDDDPPTNNLWFSFTLFTIKAV